MNTPLFSVVIPTRDRNDTLALCLDRLAPGAQALTHDQYEVIVADDSAHAAARELVTDRYPWARWVAGPRRGPAANRNAGARAARGEWLAFTDDDCLPESPWLAAFAESFSPNPAALEALEGRTTCRAGLNSPRQTAPVNLTGGLLWSCNFAMRRLGFETVGGFDERYPYPHMEDADLKSRLQKAGYMIHFVPEAEIDHPPRPLPWGTKLARVHESSVLHMVLHGPSRGLPWYLVNQLRARLSRIAREHKSLDTLSALGSLPVELVAIALNWRSWRARARALAAGPRA
ncbi:MAG: glycosyl transferase family 2 [Gemmatimonadetes bacterium]|nr:glycosyl transferase family 2 [Gemmatimonadota bacterium]